MSLTLFIDVVLLIVAVEGVILLLLRLRLSIGPKPSAIVANLAAGACLLMVARSGLGGDEMLALVWLAAAGAAHAADLAMRLR